MFSKHFIRKPRAALLGVPALVTLLALLSWLLSSPMPSAYAQESGTKQTDSQPAQGLHTAMVTLPGEITPTQVTYEVAGNYAFVEDDIILGEVDANGELIQRAEAAGQGTDGEATFQGLYWPNGVIPYTFSNNAIFKDLPNGMPSKSKQVVLDAMKHWKDKTDIEFVQWTTETDYIEFGVDPDPNGHECASVIGRHGPKQPVFASNCTVGSLIHELGHAVGLEHEHTRSDRDIYVEYTAANVEPVSKQSDFALHMFGDGMNLIGPYDYDSIMHYNCKTWGKLDTSGPTPDNLPTLNPKNPTVGCYVEGLNDGKAHHIGQREGLSPGDIAAVNAMYSFNVVGWNPSFCIGTQICTTGDMDGNGKDDIVAFNRSDPAGPLGTVWVALTNDAGAGIRWQGVWNPSFCAGNQICTIGDIDGNGKDDLVAFNRSEPGNPAGTVWVYFTNSAGTGVGWGGVWDPSFCGGNQTCTVGDMDGNGKDDLIAFNRSEPGNPVGTVWVHLANDAGTGLKWGGVWNPSFCSGNQICTVGDMDGNGKKDLVAFNRSEPGATKGSVWVYLANDAGTGVKSGGLWDDHFCLGTEVCAVANIDGTGGDDIVSFVRDSSLGTAQGNVYVEYSTGSKFGLAYRRHEFFCIGQEVCATGDMNGDGKDDIISFVRSTAPAPLTGAVWVGISRAMPLPTGGVNEPKAAVAYKDAPLVVTTDCSDPQGWRHIHSLTFRLEMAQVDEKAQSDGVLPYALWVEYDEEANQVRFYDPDSDSFLTGTPGEAKVLQNKWVSLDLAKTTVGATDASKKTVQIRWALTFSEEARSQNFKQYVQVQDDAGVYSEWDDTGTLEVAATSPTIFLPTVLNSLK